MFGIDDAILFGVGGSLLGGFLNNESASDRQDSANQFSAQQYATRYQTTVKDMKAAGLNPMLAYSGISGSAPTGAISSSPGYSDLGDSYNKSRLMSEQARVASAQVANIEADTENKAAQANLWNAQASQATASASQSTASVAFVQAQTDKVLEEIKNIPKEGDRIVAAAEQLRRLAGLQWQQQVTESQRPGQIAADTALSRSQAVQAEAVTRKVLAEAGLLDLDAEAAARLGNLGRTSKELKPVIDTIFNVLRMYRSK